MLAHPLSPQCATELSPVPLPGEVHRDSGTPFPICGGHSPNISLPQSTRSAANHGESPHLILPIFVRLLQRLEANLRQLVGGARQVE